MTPIILDLSIVAVLLASALISYFRGFIKEALSIVGILGSFAGAYIAGPLAVPFFNDLLGVEEGAKEQEAIWGFIPPELMAIALSYGIIFIVCFIVLFIFSHFISALVEEAGLGPLDRWAGVVFGLARGAILVVLVYLPFALMMEKMPEWFTKSYSGPWLDKALVWTQKTFELESKDADKKADKAKDALRETKEKAQEGYDKVDRMELERLIKKETENGPSER